MRAQASMVRARTAYGLLCREHDERLHIGLLLDHLSSNRQLMELEAAEAAAKQ